MKRLASFLLAAGVAAFTTAASVSATQAPSGPPQFAIPPYKNLKVLPQNITRENLLSTMKLFSQSLGVRCTHCHVGEEGKPLSTFDFASDAKEKKLIARAMLTMVHKINAEEFGVKDFSQVKVTCFTCHRGSTKPAVMPPDAPVPTPAPAPTERRST